jgi:hypothetical protein
MDWQFAVGLGMTILFGLLPYAVENIPRWITWPGIAIGIVLIVWALLPSECVIALWPTGWHLGMHVPSPPPPPVAAPVSAYCFDENNASDDMKQRAQQFKDKLYAIDNKEKECLHVISLTSILIFEHAVIIWSFEPYRGMYIFYDDKTKKYLPIPDRHSCPEPWCQLGSDSGLDYFAHKFGVAKPKNLHAPYLYAPYGEIAYYPNIYSDEFKNIGWLRWSCEVTEQSTFYTSFESGFAVGPYPVEYNKKDGQIIVILKDGTSSSIGVLDANRPSCKNGYL